MRKICSVLVALLLLMGVFAAGAAAAEVGAPALAMESQIFIQRGLTRSLSINLQYFEKLDTDDIFWEVENDKYFTIDNNGVITFDKFAAFFGGPTIVRALDKDGNVLGETNAIVTWKWFYYVITYLVTLGLPWPSWIGFMA